jgi:hypothetical protein
MTTNKISHAPHTKQVTKSTGAADAATTEETASPPPEIAATNASSQPMSLPTAVKTALGLILQAQNVLPLTAGPGIKARTIAVRLNSMPSELLAEAGTFLAQHGSKYPFDASLVQEAAELENQLNAVVGSAQTLISRAQETVLEKRGPAVEQALALYATLKAQSRTDASVRATVGRMEPLVNTRKTPHQKKEQRTKANAKQLAKLTGAGSGAATDGATAPVTTASPAAGATAPAAGTAPTHS